MMKDKGKDGIYVSIAFITLALLYYLIKDINELVAIPMSVCFGANFFLRPIFIARENRIKGKRRVYIIVLIIINYLSLLGVYAEEYYKIDLASPLIIIVLLTLYQILIVLYMKTIFDDPLK